MSEGPNQGRMVRYVLRTGRAAGQSRPAMVVRDWGHDGRLNLHVFLDGDNDRGADGAPPIYPVPASVALPDGGFSAYTQLTSWVTSAPYSETKEPGTWHWPTIVKA